MSLYACMQDLKIMHKPIQPQIIQLCMHARLTESVSMYARYRELFACMQDLKDLYAPMPDMYDRM